MDEARPKKRAGGGGLSDLPPQEPEWAEWWAEITKGVKWPPHFINELTFAQIVAMGGGGGSEKISVKDFGELAPHVAEYLEREKPERALADAERALAEFLGM